MLVLSRKIGEKIRIGEDIVITLVSIKGDKIRVGIEAPEEVKILREELAGEGKKIEQSASTCTEQDNV